MTGKFKAACIQVSAGRELAPNIETAVRLGREARAQGADFIAYPENVTMIEPVGADAVRKALPEAEHPAIPAFSALARETGASQRRYRTRTLSRGELAAFRSVWEGKGTGMASNNGIPTRPLGKTGVDVSILALGGFHIGVPPEAEGIRLIHTAIDDGITFMDNAWEYNDNESERRMGVALAQDGYREKAFLMTKNCAHDRTAKNSMVKLEESLRRLQTDHLDLWQIHEVTFADDPERIYAAGGAAEAMLKAKEEGKTRFIGFTGHKSPAIFRKMLSYGFPWDTIQMPVSVLDAHFNSFQTEILPLAQEQGIGVIGMKSLAAGHFFSLPEGTMTPVEARRYALSQPISSLCVGVDSMEVLEQDLALARGFVPMTAEEQTAAVDKVYHHAWAGQHEPFKTSFDFEGNEARKEHGLPLRGLAAD